MLNTALLTSVWIHRRRRQRRCGALIEVLRAQERDRLGYYAGERPKTLRRHKERSVVSGFAIGIVERTKARRSEQGQLSQVERAVVFAERTVSAWRCERGFSDSPPIGGVDPPIEDDEAGQRKSDPPTATRNPLIECK